MPPISPSFCEVHHNTFHLSPKCLLPKMNSFVLIATVSSENLQKLSCGQQKERLNCPQLYSGNCFYSHGRGASPSSDQNIRLSPREKSPTSTLSTKDWSRGVPRQVPATSHPHQHLAKFTPDNVRGIKEAAPVENILRLAKTHQRGFFLFSGISLRTNDTTNLRECASSLVEQLSFPSQKSNIVYSAKLTFRF